MPYALQSPYSYPYNNPACMRLAVKVVPKSSRNCVAGWMGDALKICVNAPPERGKANAAVEHMLATALGIAKERVRLVAGTASPRKMVEIDGLDETEVRSRLSAYLHSRSAR